MGRLKGSKNVRDAMYSATLQEVGDELGCCRERVRQIEAKALAKLRAGLLARGIDQQLWFDHLADLHKRQKTDYTVSGAFISARSIYDAEEKIDVSCNAEQSA